MSYRGLKATAIDFSRYATGIAAVSAWDLFLYSESGFAVIFFRGLRAVVLLHAMPDTSLLGLVFT